MSNEAIDAADEDHSPLLLRPQVWQNCFGHLDGAKNVRIELPYPVFNIKVFPHTDLHMSCIIHENIYASMDCNCPLYCVVDHCLWISDVELKYADAR